MIFDGKFFNFIIDFDHLDFDQQIKLIILEF